MVKVKWQLGCCLMFAVAACNNNGSESNKVSVKDSTNIVDTAAVSYDTSFKVAAQSFADIQVLRYEAPGFNQLSLRQK